MHTLNQKSQNFGADPIGIRDSQHYTEEYVPSFVDKWDELIDWQARQKSEGNFFIQELKRRGCRHVLDVATGTGFHSVQLLKAGFEVTSLDGSGEMLEKAFMNGLSHGHVLETAEADWRWLNRNLTSKYDAIICLGNSFTHLFSEQDRRKSLAEFYAALRYNGVLILDHRNYDALLDQTARPNGKYYYCGKSVEVGPEHLDEGLARFRYAFSDGNVFHLNMFPLRKQYVRKLIHEVGFGTVNTFGDFRDLTHETEPNFFIQVAEK